jgi:hypothetical protein
VTGPTAGSTNEPEDGPPSVAITKQTLAEASSSMIVTLPAHSANAIVFHR